jgi:superfamily II DNA or RNA helicase
MNNLYPYQDDAVKNVIAYFRHHKSVMLQMPTGTGKTNVFCEIIKQLNVNTLILVHTRELVYQARDRLYEDFGIDCGIIMSGSKTNDSSKVQVASIQTLILKNKDFWPKNISLIVIDEAHHSPAKTYQKILNYYKDINIKILGVTATPYRLNNVGFRGIFEQLIVSKSIFRFIKDNELVGFRHFATTTPDLSRVRFIKGINDYDLDELSKCMSSEKIMSDIIESYHNYGQGKQSILFSVDQNHSREIVARFKKDGINAEFIDSKTRKEIRKDILIRFKNKEIKVLVNVKIFTEGFDCPDISVVQLVRPTKSLSFYLQMVGRCLRKSEGKNHAIIIDNAGLWKTHGLITKDITWTLDGVTINNTNVARKVNGNEVIEEPYDRIKEIAGLEMQELISVFPQNFDILSSIKLKFGEVVEIEISPQNDDSLLIFLGRVLDKIINYTINASFNSIKATVKSNVFLFTSIELNYLKNVFFDFQNGFVNFYLDNIFVSSSNIKKIKIVDDVNSNLHLQRSKTVDELKLKLSTLFKVN